MSSCNSCKEKSLFNKTLSWLKAMFSKRNKILGNQRIAICQTYNKVFNKKELSFKPCEYLNEKNGKIFCNACNCPQSGFLSKYSDLNYKANLTGAKCPEDRW